MITVNPRHYLEVVVSNTAAIILDVVLDSLKTIEMYHKINCIQNNGLIIARG